MTTFGTKNVHSTVGVFTLYTHLLKSIWQNVWDLFLFELVRLCINSKRVDYRTSIKLKKKILYRTI